MFQMKALSPLLIPLFFWACLRQATGAICAGIYPQLPPLLLSPEIDIIVRMNGRKAKTYRMTVKVNQITGKKEFSMKNQTKQIGIIAIITCIVATGMFSLIGCTTAKTYMENGDYYFEKGEYNRAMQFYSVLISEYPKSPKAQIAREKIEEAQAIIASEKAKQEAAAEARRKAEEEANRYDPSKFTIVPDNFKPANYESTDLFNAIARVETLAKNRRLSFRCPYVSDFVFVSQNGTDILFRTDDNAISQYMKVYGRSGLTAGQKVRVYYIALIQNSLIEWQVIAIERL